MRAIITLPRSSWTGAQTLFAWDELTPRINGARSLGDLPLAVVSVTHQPLVGQTLTALQNQLPALSTNSVHRTVYGRDARESHFQARACRGGRRRNSRRGGGGLLRHADCARPLLRGPL